MVLLIAALGALPGYVWAYRLSGASETPTILPGDTFVVNRAAYDVRLPYSRMNLVTVGSPQHGEIVQAYLPMGIGLGIKRVLGVPGETIEIRENLVIVNGQPLPTRKLHGAAFTWVPAATHMGSDVMLEDGHWVAWTPGESEYRNSPPLHLGTGEYFLMGDNRDNSIDSRAFGPVTREQITGRVFSAYTFRHSHRAHVP